VRLCEEVVHSLKAAMRVWMTAVRSGLCHCNSDEDWRVLAQHWKP